MDDAFPDYSWMGYIAMILFAFMMVVFFVLPTSNLVIGEEIEIVGVVEDGRVYNIPGEITIKTGTQIILTLWDPTYFDGYYFRNVEYIGGN
jgi:hypothetical protein